MKDYQKAAQALELLRESEVDCLVICEVDENRYGRCGKGDYPEMLNSAAHHIAECFPNLPKYDVAMPLMGAVMQGVERAYEKAGEKHE